MAVAFGDYRGFGWRCACGVVDSDAVCGGALGGCAGEFAGGNRFRAVKSTEFTPFAFGLEMRRPKAEAHGAPESYLINFRHQDYDWVRRLLVKFIGCGVWEVANVAGELDDRDLHA